MSVLRQGPVDTIVTRCFDVLEGKEIYDIRSNVESMVGMLFLSLREDIMSRSDTVWFFPELTCRSLATLTEERFAYLSCHLHL